MQQVLIIMQLVVIIMHQVAAIMCLCVFVLRGLKKGGHINYRVKCQKEILVELNNYAASLDNYAASIENYAMSFNYCASSCNQNMRVCVCVCDLGQIIE